MSFDVDLGSKSTRAIARLTNEESTTVAKVMVRYTVKAGAAALNEELVRAVYDELTRTTPLGIRYATFVMDDGVSFVHLAWNDDPADGHNPLMDVAAFRAFQEGVQDRCEVRPVVTPLREIGSYGIWSS
jgi:hypothetical protein